jgi:hypothetical protein
MHRLLRFPWLLIWIGAVVLIGLGLTLVLALKNIEVDSDLTVRTFFGKMGENDTQRVMTRAEEYLKQDDYATCRRLAEFVADHGGEYADDGMLLCARAFFAEGDFDGTYQTLSAILEKYSQGSAVQANEFGNLASKSLNVILAQVPADINRAAKFLRLLADSASAYFPEAKKIFDQFISAKQDLQVEYIFDSKKVMLLSSDAISEAKSEGIFKSKQETPLKMVEKIKSLAILEGLVDDAAIETYVRKNLKYDAVVEKVERVPFSGEELSAGEGSSEFAQQELGYRAQVRCIGKIVGFSLADLFREAGVDPYQTISSS